MKMGLMKVLMSSFRSNGYLVFGVCFGLGISILLLEADETGENFWIKSELESIPGGSREIVDEYIPKVNVEDKPRRAQKTPKSFVRPRYYFTELGIREKIFFGVLTSQEYLHNRGIAFNKTVAHLVEKIRYFIAIPEGSKKPNVTLSGIVGFTDTRSILKPFHVIKYITDNYLEDFDYYFLVKDTAYINVRRLMDLIDGISISKDVHLGLNVDNPSDSKFCTFDAGILISNSIIKRLKENLDWCVKNIYSSLDDVNFGRCVLHATNIPCTNQIDGNVFYAKQLPEDFNFEKNLKSVIEEEEKLEKSLSIYPLFDHLNVYKMHAYLAGVELKRIESMIDGYRNDILSSSHQSPSRNVSWPVGNNSGNKSPGRFDVLRWNYFNETHIFMPNDFENHRQLIGNKLFDINYTLTKVIDKIINDNDGELKFDKLVNGYERFDASRGMDYYLDLSFINVKQGEKILKRIQVCKPLGKVEVLSVPYVTENTRINMILIVDPFKINSTLEYIDSYEKVCMEKKQKTSLMLVLLYNPESPSKGSDDIYQKIKSRALNLTDKYRKDQTKITWLSIRLPTIILLNDPILKVAVTDLIIKKFPLESLILFTQSNMELKTEYFNRVRMNTIIQWQIFSPIPFSQYNPDLINGNNNLKYLIDFDINHKNGRYDDLNYDNIGFYAKDYQLTRKLSENDIPIIHKDKDIIILLNYINNLNSLLDLFIKYNDYHIFRAVEPALKINYNEIKCDYLLNQYIKKTCQLQKYYQLGNRGQIAKLIEEYHQNS